MAHEIAHFSCCLSPLPDLLAFSVLFLRISVCHFVHSVMGKDKPRQSRALQHFIEAYIIIGVRMVEQRIVLLDPLEMFVLCTTILWVLLVDGTSPTVLVRARCHLHNPQSGLSSCWSSSKRTRWSLGTSRMSLQVHLQKWPRNNVHRIPSFILRGTRNNMSSTETSWRKSMRLSNRLMPMSGPPSLTKVRTCSSSVISVFCWPRNMAGIPWLLHSGAPGHGFRRPKANSQGCEGEQTVL